MYCYLMRGMLLERNRLTRARSWNDFEVDSRVDDGREWISGLVSWRVELSCSPEEMV